MPSARGTAVEKRVAVERFLDVPLGAERTFSFRPRRAPAGRRLLRVLGAAGAVVALGLAAVAPLASDDGPVPAAGQPAEPPATLPVDASVGASG